MMNSDMDYRLYQVTLQGNSYRFFSLGKFPLKVPKVSGPHKEEKDIDLAQVDREDSPDGSP